MPLIFFIAGLILVVIGINGTIRDAGNLLKRDFVGPGNFFTWFFAILFAGALGYIPTFKPISTAFLVLVFVVLLLTSGSGFFARLQQTMEWLQKRSSTDDTKNNSTELNIVLDDWTLPAIPSFDVFNSNGTYSI